MRTWMKSAAMGLAWALFCSSALAEDRVELNSRALEGVDSLYTQTQGRPLDDQQLDQLRGRLAAPMPQQAGVVLWDEPSKGLPPVRGTSEPHNGSSVTTTFTIHLRSP